MATVREVVDRIIAGIGVPVPEKTVDTFKAGDPDVAVKGVAVTFMSTYDVLRRAGEMGVNLVITHEPTFWHGLDTVEHVAGDVLYRKKLELIEKHKLVLWRCHDLWHKRRPDGIMEGMVEALGWKGYQRAADWRIFDLPGTTLGELGKFLKERLGGKVSRCMGRPGMPVKCVAMAPGAPGARTHFDLLLREGMDVLITGEGAEWEVSEYVRDASDAGLNKGLVFVGHRNSEEAGMEYLARWLRPRLEGIRVEYLETGDGFWGA